MPPSLALADSACLSASARTFFGRSIAWLRTHRTERTAAAAEQIDAGGAVTGAAGALLPVHLLAGAADLGAVLDRRGCRRGAWRAARRTQRWMMSARGSRPKIASESLTEPASLPSSDMIFSSMSRALLVGRRASAGAASALPRPPPHPAGGTCRASARPSAASSSPRRARVIQPPLAPGTAPSTRMRPRSTSVCTTLRLSVVTRSTPIWPGIFLFLKVLPGS